MSIELTIEILSEEIDLPLINSNSFVFLVGVVSTETGQGFVTIDVFIVDDLKQRRKRKVLIEMKMFFFSTNFGFDNVG